MSPASSFPILILSRGGPIDGLQRQLSYLVRGIDRNRFPPMAALAEESALTEAFVELDVDHRIHPMASWRSPVRWPWRLRDVTSLTRLARDSGTRIVHAQDVWRAGYARAVGRRLGIPSIVHIRGPLSQRDIRKHILHRADALIAIARRYADDLEAAGIDPGAIHVIDDAVDLDLFSRDRARPNILRDHFGIPDGLRVGLVGRVTPFKRVTEFIETIAALPVALRETTSFVIVGAWEEPDYRCAVEALVARHGLGGRTHFLGRTGEETASVLADLDLLTTFSGGSVMFEAMAMGTPVLSIRTDSRHSEHTRHDETAWCVTTSERSVAAEAMKHLLDDRNLRLRLGEAGREHVRRHLSVARMASKTEAVYERLLQGSI